MSAVQRQLKRKAGLISRYELNSLTKSVKDCKNNSLYAETVEKEGKPRTANQIISTFFGQRDNTKELKTQEQWEKEGYKIVNYLSPKSLWGRPIEINGKKRFPMKLVFNEKQVKKEN